jgi:sugar transferase (PEP-CTERM/EpsH1 system associated)
VKPPFHIAHVVFDLERGGLQNGLANLVERLSPERFRHSVFALASLGPAAERLAAVPGTRVRALGRRGGRDLGVAFRLARALREDRPAIVRTYNWATWVEGFMAARLARVPVHIHSEHQQPFGETPRERRRRDRVRRFLARRADAVVALSSEIAARFERDLGADPARVEVIVNGVDFPRIEEAVRRADRAARLGALGVPAGALVIGAVGRCVVEKDFGSLVAALPRILAAAPAAHLVIAGDGPLREGLARRAAALGVEGRVHLAGARPDVPELLGCFDIFALPSLSEGISNTILEAMVAGLPIVTTPVGGTPEILEDDRTAVFVRPADPEGLARAIVALAHDPARRAALGREARRAAREERSLDEMVRRYERLYVEVLWRKGLLGAPGGREVAPCAA